MKSEFINIQKELLGDEPSVLLAHVQNGRYAYAGINAGVSEREFVKIDQTPKTMLARWWALIQLTASDIHTVCAAFGLKTEFENDLRNMCGLYELPCAENMPELKTKLAGLSQWQQQNYTEIIAAFSALNTEFYTEQLLYLHLIENNEPYRIEDLAVDKALLVAEGIRKSKADYILTLVLNAVIKNPQIKTASAQLKLAKQLNAII